MHASDNKLCQLLVDGKHFETELKNNLRKGQVKNDSHSLLYSIEENEHLLSFYRVFS